MKMAKRPFTVVLDGLIMKQIDCRARVTGRSRSQEICYLLHKAVELNPPDADLVSNPIDFPFRTSANLETHLHSSLAGRACEMRVSVGRLVNNMLKYVIDKQATDNQQIMDDMARRDQAERSLSRTEVDG